MRHVAITGAGNGLGKVCARRFGEAGDCIHVCDISPDSLTALVAEKWVGTAETVDVSNRNQVNAFFDQILRRTDRIDVLVNNVGVAGHIAPVEEIPPDAWSATLDANLNAGFWGIQRVLPHMKQAAGGVILNVSTFSVRTVPQSRAPYIVAKAGLEALTRVVAREAGPWNIRCNAVRPGAMDNERLARVMSNLAERTGRTVASVEAELLRYTSMRSKVSMDEVADLLYFLASDAAAHITSQIISVDAGAQWEE